MKTKCRFGILGVLVQLLLYIHVTGQMIDSPPPAFTDPPSPWHAFAPGSVVTYSFQTSYDGIAWTWDQKQLFRDAVHQIDDVLPDISFVESGDFTMRWAGADFFKDWRDKGKYSDGGWDLSGPLAVSYKHNNGPWDPKNFPNNEIYFNKNMPWSFRFTGVTPGSYDFWTTSLHEIIHMLACDAHATDPDEVMYPTLQPGERKSLKASDLEILKTAGYSTTSSRIRGGPVPVPESSSYALGSCLLLLVSAIARKKIRAD